jgi:sporulation protein YlmC with PRC-barrel domain
MKRFHFTSAALALTIAAGTASTAIAQNSDNRYGSQDRQHQTDRDRNSDRDTQDRYTRSQADQSTVKFVSFDDVEGMTVVNHKGEELAEISDLIFDRGSGEIAHVVLGHGGVLGMGDTEFAVPYDRFTMDERSGDLMLRVSSSSSDRSKLNATKGWIKLTEGSWTEQLQKQGNSSMNRQRNDRWDDDERRDGDSQRWDDDDRNMDRDTDADRNRDRNTDRDRDRDRNVDRNRDRADRDRSDREYMNDSYDRSYREDPFQDHLKNAQTEQIEGKVKEVRRVEIDGEEYIVAIVDPDARSSQNQRNTGRNNNGNDRSTGNRDNDRDQDRQRRGASNEDTLVLLGPSWYVMSQENEPQRGTMVSMRGADLQKASQSANRHTPGGTDNRTMWMPGYHERNQFGDGNWYVAYDAQYDGKNAQYRERDSTARWTERSGDNTPRYMLVSQLEDRDIETHDDNVGEIEDVIIEVMSGSIGYLSIDPDENFMGIGDEEKAVPWSVVSIGPRGQLRIDSDGNALQNAQAMPEDLSNLENKSQRDSLYTAYDAEPKTYKTDRAYDRHQGWGPNTDLAQKMKEGKRNVRTIEGEVASTGSVRSVEGLSEGWTVTIETDSGRKTVLVAPMNVGMEDELKPDRGTDITVKAQQVTLNGEQFWVARSVEMNGKEHELWDDQDRPQYLSRR